MIKKKLDKRYNNFIRLFALAMILLAVISLLAFIGLINTGFTETLVKAQCYLLGVAGFLFPFLLIFISLNLMISNRKLKKNLFLFCYFVLCLIGTAHNIYVPLNEELYPQHLLNGGGLLGGSFVLILHKLLGYEFSGIIIGILWLGFAYIIIPFKAIGAYLKELWGTEQADTVQEEPIYVEDILEKKFVASANKKSDNNYTDVYDKKEFSSFSDGIHSKRSFRSILNFTNKNAYSSSKVKKEILKNPVQIPEWEEAKTVVVVRPVVDYVNGGYREDSKLAAKEEKAYTGYSQHMETAETEKNTSVEPKAVTYQQEKRSSAVYDEPKKPIIIDSADKITEAADRKADNKQILEIDPNDDRYIFPEVGLLDIPKTTDPKSYANDIMEQCSILEQTLADFRVKASVTAVTRGPSVTRFELEPAPGVKVSSVVNLADDIALKLAASGVRIEAPIPGKAAIGIEVPNTKNDPVYFREVVDNKLVYGNESKLCIGLGKDISGNIITADLAKMPHLLVAGSTGSGKSVCINTIIAGILFKASPDEVKLILVDPKVVELSNYNGIPHLLTPVVTDAKKAASALHWAVAEMERRYKLFADRHVREINSYNRVAEEKIPFIVIIIDELSDLMMVAKADVEDAILRLAQKARAAGIHLILATQRPSVDVITGIVKANIPSRIAFAVSSQTDSRTILDIGGAEKLLGKGDMLFYPIGQNKPVRVQGAFVSDAELNRIVDFIIAQSIPVNYSDEITSQALESDNKMQVEGSSGSICDDELFEEAVRLVMDLGQASSSMLQRRFRIGYTRAARLVDIMEELGIVGQSAGSKPREVILSRQEIEDRFLTHE